MTLAEAYQATMDWLKGTKRAYRQVPIEVLADLATYCRATETCVIPGNHDKSLLLAGRHEVWLRIQEFRNLTPEQLYQIKTGSAITPTGEQQ